MRTVATGSPSDIEIAPPPRIDGESVRLRPVSTEDYGYLQDLFSEVHPLAHSRLRGATPPPDEFVDALWHGVMVQFVIERRDRREPHGLISAVAANLRDGFVHLELTTRREELSSGPTGEAVSLFVAYLFRVWPLRKIYLDVAQFNLTDFRQATAVPFVEEARLKGHEFQDGRYWDVHVLAVYRSASEADAGVVAAAAASEDR